MPHNKSKCPCPDCRADKSQKNAEYRELKRTVWTPNLLRRDPARASEHLQALAASGVADAEIHNATGISRTQLRAIRLGTPTFIRADMEERILAVTAATVPSTVMARAKILMLQDQGWTQDQIADAAGCAQSAISSAFRKSVLRPGTIRKILAVDPDRPPVKHAR